MTMSLLLYKPKATLLVADDRSPNRRRRSCAASAADSWVIFGSNRALAL